MNLGQALWAAFLSILGLLTLNHIIGTEALIGMFLIVIAIATCATIITFFIWVYHKLGES